MNDDDILQQSDFKKSDFKSDYTVCASNTSVII